MCAFVSSALDMTFLFDELFVFHEHSARFLYTLFFKVHRANHATRGHNVSGSDVATERRENIF